MTFPTIHVNFAGVVLFVVLFGAFVGRGVSAQTTRNVPASYATIQAAINAAVDGDTVLVQPGTYVQKINFMGKAITVRSAAGAAVTTIDGNFTGTVVRFMNGEGPNSILDGFTIKNGVADVSVSFSFFGTYPPRLCGGGVYAKGSPTIRNCRIMNCVAQCGGGIFARTAPGAGVNQISQLVTVESCEIIGNALTHPPISSAGAPNNGGAAMAFIFDGLSASYPLTLPEYDVTVRACLVDGNVAMLPFGDQASIIRLDLSFAFAPIGGIHPNVRLILDGCAVTNNVAANTNYPTPQEVVSVGLGGGFDCLNTTITDNQGIGVRALTYFGFFINNSDVSRNTIGLELGNGSPFGYVYVVEQPKIIGSIIADNLVHGVRVGVGGLMDVRIESSTIRGNGTGVIITSNGQIVGSSVSMNDGDGIFIYANSVNTVIDVDSCAVIGNGGYPTSTLTTYSGLNALVGVGLISSVSVKNSILRSNAGPITFGPPSGIPLLDFSNCNLDFAWTGSGTGNIGGDPMFVDGAAGDYHLLPTSPCIDAGDSMAVAAGAEDIDGGPRVIGAAVDIGADEFVLGLERSGAIFDAAGRPDPVLRVNGRSGIQSGVVMIGVGEPIMIEVATPSISTSAENFVIWGKVGIPAPGNGVVSPFGGLAFVPLLADPSDTSLFTLTNSLFPDPSSVLTATSTPWSYTLAAGVPFPFDITLQGLMFLSSAPAPTLQTTNGLVVHVAP